MTPLFLLKGDVKIADDAADENELLAEAADVIPTCVTAIRDFWRSRRKPAHGRGRRKRH